MSSAVGNGTGSHQNVARVPHDTDQTPRPLRVLEPLTCLTLAGHAVAVRTLASQQGASLMIAVAFITLLGLGLAGLAGVRSRTAVVTRALAVLVLGFLLQVLLADSGGFFSPWFFILVSVYPLVLPSRAAWLVIVATPVGYLALVPLNAVDASAGTALLRALSLVLIGVSVRAATVAQRGAAAAHDIDRELLDTFVTVAPVGLAHWDENARFQRVNRAFAELAGSPVDEHVGRRVADVPGLPAAVAENVRQVLAEGRPMSDVDLGRDEREWSAGFYPVRSAQGIVGVGAVLLEMTGQGTNAPEPSRSQAKALQTLATLQTALLPAEVSSQHGVTVVARYRAAGQHDQMGGDWYDTIPLPTGGLALIIGDVEGHDLTAASVMGLVRGAVRSYALEGHPPSIVLQRVSVFLMSAGIDRLVTMAYVQLYPGVGVATVALAGHPPPLVVAHDGATSSELEMNSGLILGVDGPARWDERTVLLPRQALLVLYTDGVTAGPAGSPDGLEELAARAALAGPDPVNQVADALISAAPGHDDAAVLVARVTSGSAPSLRRTFPAQPISAGIARTWIADLFDLWRASGALPERGVSVDEQETAQLLLTELVSNAVRHSDESVGVAVRLSGRRLRVDVADTSERMPVMRRPEAAAAEGRGLRLVDVLSSAWGVDLIDRGKSVWFELDLDPGGDADADDPLIAFGGPDE